MLGVVSGQLFPDGLERPPAGHDLRSAAGGSMDDGLIAVGAILPIHFHACSHSHLYPHCSPLTCITPPSVVGSRDTTRRSSKRCAAEQLGGGWEANPCFVELKLFVVISCNINALPLEAFSAPGTLLREIQENLDR